MLALVDYCNKPKLLSNIIQIPQECRNKQTMYVAMFQNHMERTFMPLTMASPLSTVSITGLEEQLV